MTEGQVITGWDKIARYLGWSKSKAISLKGQLLADGIIFYELAGSPPARCVRAYPDDLKRWHKEQGQN